jgi:hypothetical protein
MLVVESRLHLRALETEATLPECWESLVYLVPATAVASVRVRGRASCSRTNLGLGVVKAIAGSD